MQNADFWGTVAGFRSCWKIVRRHTNSWTKAASCFVRLQTNSLMWLDPAPMRIEWLEEVAGNLLRAVDAHVPVSAFALADSCGLTIVPHGVRISAVRGAALSYAADYDGTTIAVFHAQEPLVAAHIAHWWLSSHGYECTEARVQYLARALLLPFHEFFSDLRRTHDIAELKHIHRFAGEAFIRERMADIGHREPLRLIVA